MNCKIGDRVRFLNDVGGGIVTRIIDSKTVSVTTEDGFEVPVLYSELVIVGQGDEKLLKAIPNQDIEISKQNGLRKTTKKDLPINSNKNIIQINEEIDPTGSSIGLYLAFVPTDAIKTSNSDFNLFIINDSNYRIFYLLSVWKNSELEPINLEY